MFKIFSFFLFLLVFSFPLYSESIIYQRPDESISSKINIDKSDNLIISISSNTYTYDVDIGSVTLSRSACDFGGVYISSTSANTTYDVYDSSFVNVTAGAVLDSSQLIMSIPAGSVGYHPMPGGFIRTKRGLAVNQTAIWKVTIIYKP